MEALLPVTTALSNSYGTLHGGASATVIDIVGSMALLSRDPTRPGVSVEINTTYTSAAKVGETVRVVGRYGLDAPCLALSCSTQICAVFYEVAQYSIADVTNPHARGAHCAQNALYQPSVRGRGRDLCSKLHIPCHGCQRPASLLSRLVFPTQQLTIIYTCRVLKSGKKLGFTQVDIFRADGMASPFTIRTADWDIVGCGCRFCYRNRCYLILPLHLACRHPSRYRTTHQGIIASQLPEGSRACSFSSSSAAHDY